MTRVLVVGLGGLGCPVAGILARGGHPMTLLDDDLVERTNLHRQPLYTDRDVGRPKVEAAHAALAGADVRPVRARLVPETAEAIVEGHALVVEGADNYATKFLAHDTARRLGVPIVQGGAVGTGGWALASTGRGACLRCVFESSPDASAGCDVLGVLGPVVGVVGALVGALALSTLHGDEVGGTLVHYDALRGRIARSNLPARPSCTLCGSLHSGLSRGRYAPSSDARR